jgi:hypothetical protein
MYATGERPEVGDIVNGSDGRGEVLKVISNGIGGQENVLVQWSTVHERAPGYRARKAPTQVPTQSLTLVRRKSS